MTSAPHGDNGPEMVEKQLAKVCKDLIIAEVRADLLGRMVREGVATADVRNFVGKQAKLKRANKKVHLPVAKHAMRDKFNDTVAAAEGLRKKKKCLTEVLINEFGYSKKKCRNLIRTYLDQVLYSKLNATPS